VRVRYHCDGHTRRNVKVRRKERRKERKKEEKRCCTELWFAAGQVSQPRALQVQACEACLRSDSRRMFQFLLAGRGESQGARLSLSTRQAVSVHGLVLAMGASHLDARQKPLKHSAASKHILDGSST
jgi:hypothetical protein